MKVLYNPYADITSQQAFMAIAHEIEKLELLTQGNADYQYEISYLPSNMSSLIVFICNGCNLQSLPDGMIALRTLECDNNNLRHLPAYLSRSLRAVSCDRNCMTSFFDMPTPHEEICPLEIVYCRSNKLTSLPSNWNHVYILHCEDNNITSLPQGMHKLLNLHCKNNPIQSIPNGMNLLRFVKADNITLEADYVM